MPNAWHSITNGLLRGKAVLQWRRDLSFHVSAEQTEPWASGPLAVQASKVGGPRVSPGASGGAAGDLQGHVAGGGFTPPGPRRQTSPPRAVICSRPPRQTGQGVQPGVSGLPGRPRASACGRCLPLAGAGFEGRPAPAGSRKGRGFPAPRTRRHGNAAFLANRPGPGAARRASWAEPGMDSLFVEEVAASLVREFLSRKVRGVARADRCNSGRPGAPPEACAPSGRETSPCC